MTIVSKKTFSKPLHARGPLHATCVITTRCALYAPKRRRLTHQKALCTRYETGTRDTDCGQPRHRYMIAPFIAVTWTLTSLLHMYIMFNGSFVTRLTCVSSVTRLPMSSLQVLPNVQFSRISARIKHRLVSGCACRASSATDPCIRVTYKQN